MSNISNNTIVRLEKCLYQGTSWEAAFPKLDQRFRAEVTYEFYLRWQSNKDIAPRTVCRNIARARYQRYVRLAAMTVEGVEDEKLRKQIIEAQEYIRALHITVMDNGEIRPRTEVEIANDVQMCNAIIKYFQEQDDSVHRHKAMVLDNAEWLMREGKKQNNDKAVGKGIDTMMKLYDDFKEKDNAADEMPNANINISDDPTTVRRDRTKYSDEDMRRAYKEFGLSEKKVQTLVEQSDGSWALPDEDPERNEMEEEDVIIQRDKTHSTPPDFIDI